MRKYNAYIYIYIYIYIQCIYIYIYIYIQCIYNVYIYIYIFFYHNIYIYIYTHIYIYKCKKNLLHTHTHTHIYIYIYIYIYILVCVCLCKYISKSKMCPEGFVDTQMYLTSVTVCDLHLKPPANTSQRNGTLFRRVIKYRDTRNTGHSLLHDATPHLKSYMKLQIAFPVRGTSRENGIAPRYT